VPAPHNWPEVLRAPAFVINLDARPDRLASSKEELHHAGFRDVRRFAAIDAAAPGVLDEAWGRLGAPRFDSRDEWFRVNAGAQGCLLSHIGVWAEIIDQNLPFACVFEDDIFFHRHWTHLAPTYFDFTPTDYDVLFMGSRIVELGARPRPARTGLLYARLSDSPRGGNSYAKRDAR
jgi:GR25 family glycosyltransferase involved in LPS biosynthesis